MARTAQLDLPLVLPSQAQKHVTVNEALARLDATAQLRVVSSTVATPPAGEVDGASYLVPAGVSGDWTGRAGQVAIWSNGGWIFLSPKAGWCAWDESRDGCQRFDGTAWIPDALVVSRNGAATVARVVEFDHAIAPGATNATSVVIPDKAQVIGVTGRVAAQITGSGVSGWRIGVAGSGNRYGSGLGLAVGSYLVGLSGAPVTYYEDTPLLLAAEGGAFTGGIVRLAIHLVELLPPRP